MINDKKKNCYNEQIYNFIGTANSPILFAMAGITFPDPDYEIIRRVSDAYSIEYVYEGEGVIQHGSQIFRISAGDFFILHPNEYHHYMSSKKKPWKKIWILFSDGCPYVSHLIKDYNLTETVYVPQYNKPKLLEKCLEEIKANTTKTGRNLEFLIHSLIADVSDYEFSSKNKILTTAEQIKLFLDRNLQNKLKIENCCDFVHLEKSQVFKVFHKAYGTSPMAYHKRAKINNSIVLLTQTDLSISVITKNYAFNNVYHYSKAFKNIVGMSPSEYRKSNKK